MKPKLGFDAQQEKRKMNAKKLKKAFHFSFDDFPCLFPFVSKDQFSFQNATRKIQNKKV